VKITSNFLKDTKFFNEFYKTVFCEFHDWVRSKRQFYQLTNIYSKPHLVRYKGELYVTLCQYSAEEGRPLQKKSSMKGVFCLAKQYDTILHMRKGNRTVYPDSRRWVLRWVMFLCHCRTVLSILCIGVISVTW